MLRRGYTDEVRMLEDASRELSSLCYDAEALAKNLKTSMGPEEELTTTGVAGSLRDALANLKRRIEDALANTTDPVLCAKCEHTAVWERGKSLEPGSWQHADRVWDQDHDVRPQ